ncbi:MAG: hypothetical protein JRF61_13185 [Deltaproteobacteria bacterium]|jgi:hypothetical protein|nr:hypothetical protein [Deltaproteobacteria bacterium]
MSYELRPLTLAEILDAAFRLVQTEWRTLVGLSMIMQIPLIALGSWAEWLFDPLADPVAPGEEVMPEALVEMGVILGAVGPVYLVLYPFIAAAVTASVGNFYLGRRFELGDALRVGLRSVLRLVASYLVYGLAFFGAMLVIGGAIAMAGMLVSAAFGGLLDAMGSLGIGLGVVVVVVVGGFVLFWFLFLGAVASLLPPVAVLESEGIVGTVSRAYGLGGTAKWRVIGVVFAAGMIVGFPVFGAQMMIGFVPVLGILVWAVFQAIGFAFTTSVAVVLYFDLRCRAESYDLELLAQQVEAGPGLGHG